MAVPYASIAAPPTRSSRRSTSRSSAPSTLRASAMTSGPMPSPGRTASVYLAIHVPQCVHDAIRRASPGLSQLAQVVVGDLVLSIGQHLEPRERVIQLVLVEQQPELFQAVAERVAPGVLAQHVARAFGADRGRRYDLVRTRVLEHAVLVPPALVGEGIGAHDGLVRLNRDTGQALQHLAGRHDLFEVDPMLHLVMVAAHRQGQRELLERRVAGPLADAIDAALDLPRAGLDRR